MSASETYSRSGSRGLPWTSVIRLDRVPLGQRRQPAPRRRVDRVAGPLRGRAGLGVEPLDLAAADGGGVVVATDAVRPELAQSRHHGVRIRTVADDVAELPDGIDVAGVGEDRIERHEIAVDVRQDRDAHRGRG